jgi:hypothetical protein
VLARAGFPLLQIRLDGKGKRPRFRWKRDLASRYTDPDSQEWPADHAIGIACDMVSVSNPDPDLMLVVIDVDDPTMLPNDLKAILELYPTAKQCTRADEPGRARHVYWTDQPWSASTKRFPKHPSEDPKSRKAAFGEVRAYGGQFVVAPYPGGTRYWERREIRPLPAEWLSG